MSTSLRRQVCATLHAAQAMLTHCGGFIPIINGYKSGQLSTFVILRSFDTDELKYRVMVEAMAYLRATDVESMVLVLDAYMKQNATSDHPDHRLADDPEATECLMAFGIQRPEMEVFMARIPYGRDDHGHIQFQSPLVDGSGPNIGGQIATIAREVMATVPDPIRTPTVLPELERILTQLGHEIGHG